MTTSSGSYNESVKDAVMEAPTKDATGGVGFNDADITTTTAPKERRLLDPRHFGLDPSNTGAQVTMSLLDAVETSGRFMQSLVPFDEYIFHPKKNFENLQNMTGEQQVNALLWETAMAAVVIGPLKVAKGIWAVPGVGSKGLLGVAARGAGKVVDKSYRFAFPLPKRAVLEPLAKWEAKSYFRELPKSVAEHTKLAGAELKAMTAYAKGETNALTEYLLSVKGDVSAQFQKLIVPGSTLKRTPGKVAPSVALKPEMARLFSPSAVRHAGMIRQYQAEVGEILKKNKKLYGGEARMLHELSANSFHKLLEKTYGRKVVADFAKNSSKGIRPEMATPQQIADVMELITTKRGAASVKQAAGFSKFGYFGSVQHVMGLHESSLGMFSKVWKPVNRSWLNDRAAKAFEYSRLEKILLEYKLLERTAKGKVKPTAAYSGEVQDRVALYLREVERVSKKVMQNKGKLSAQDLSRITGGLTRIVSGASPTDKAARQVLRAVGHFNDKMYADFAKWRLPEALGIRQTNNLGRAMIDKLVMDVSPRIDKIFSRREGLTVAQKSAEVGKILKEVRNKVAAEGEHWYSFKTPGEARAVMQRLEGALTPGKGFTQYKYGLVKHSPTWKGRAMNTLVGADKKKDAFYQEVQFLSGHKDLSLQQMLSQRIARQTNMIHLAKGVQEAAGAAKSMPKAHRDYVEHFLARAAGLPSQVDAGMAQFLENTLGAAQRRLGGAGLYDAYDVLGIAMKANDMTYAGFLGFKPFSAMRNLFQPLIMVPTDLGGIKDFKHLAEAYHALFRGRVLPSGRKITGAELRAEIREMGLIPREITSEFGTSARALAHDKKLFGKRLPKGAPDMDDIKQWSMKMFSMSHDGNCYVTAAAAMGKWDKAFQAFEQSGYRTYKRFVQKAGVAGRAAPIRADIEILLKQKSYKEARQAFVESVVADTQYMYNPMYTPLVTGLGGGIGKTAFIFQTWWMHYGTTIHKWATLGIKPSEKAQKMISLVFSGGAAYGIMRGMWDHEVAKKTVLFGPFPSPGEMFRPPPAWKAVFEGIRMATTIGGLSVSEKPYTERVAKQAARLAKTGFPLVIPGGLQLLQTGKRMTAEPSEDNAFIKSLIRFKKAQQ